MVFRQRNSQRFDMDMSAAEVKRAASAQPQPLLRRSRTAPKSWSAACRPKASSTSGATPAARCSTSTTRSTSRTRIEHVLVRHEQAAVHAADGYARATGEVGVALVTSGPGVTNAVTGIATAYMDSIPMVIITGPGADAGDRPRRLPGMRHRRHHAPDRQAQLPRQGRARPGADDEEGLPHRAHRPARARWWSTSRRTCRCKTAPFHYPSQRRDALVQPGAQGPRRADPQGGAAAAGGQAPVHLHRRRRDPRQRLGRAARAGRPARLPVHQHADGPGRHRRRATASSSACSACTAPTKPT